MDPHAIVGFGFHPTEPELVGHYLYHKILGDNRIVDEAIKEVNIYNFAPEELPLQSVFPSKTRMWYFVCPRDVNATRQVRQAKGGKWKITGPRVEIKDVHSRYSQVPATNIGYKRVLTFKLDSELESTQSVVVQQDQRDDSTQQKSDWVIHEFYYSLVPEDQRTYVICRLEYKGKENIFDYPIDHIDTAMEIVPVDQQVQANYEANNTNLEGISNPSNGALSYQANYEATCNNLEGIQEDWINENISFDDDMLQEDSGFLNDLPMYDTFEIGGSSTGDLQWPGNWNQEEPALYEPGALDDETPIIHDCANQFQ